MPSCPNCQSELPDDIGLVVCESCGSSVMMGMDGNISLASEQLGDDLALDTSGLHSEMLQSELSEDDYGQSQVIDTPAYVENLEVEAQQAEEGPENANSVTDYEFNSISAPEEGLDAESEDIGDAQILDIADTVMKVETEENFDEVVEYGNSDASTWSEGNIKYRIFISGLDSNDIRKSVKAVMSDPNFQWDIAGLFSTVENGELVLSGVNPVKASEFIKRLRPFSVNVRWEQYVLQQSN